MATTDDPMHSRLLLNGPLPSTAVLWRVSADGVLTLAPDLLEEMAHALYDSFGYHLYTPWDDAADMFKQQLRDHVTAMMRVFAQTWRGI